MGLTIQYSLKTSGPEGKARRLVHLLHEAAQDLPFDSVGKVVELKGVLADKSHHQPGHPLSDLLEGACEYLEYDRCSTGTNSSTCRTALIYPHHLIGFETLPGKGCEPGRFGVCRYPAFVEGGPSRRIRTGLSGWRWNVFCKTQYASNPKCGGVENFLRCHLSMVALLDKAKAVGFDVEVDDEGGFWSKRSVPDLVREVGTWNENLAGLFGVLQSVGGQGVQGAIQEFPNFEHLEAIGLNKPELVKLRQLFSATGAKFDTPPV
jgi:hypothetical protein